MNNIMPSELEALVNDYFNDSRIKKDKSHNELKNKLKATLVL